MPKAIVRHGLLKDIPGAMRLAADFHNASAYRDHPLDLAKVDQLVHRMLADPAYFCVALADSVTDEIHGYLLAMAHEHYFSKVRTVTDIGFYIEPEWRSPLAARSMVAQLEAWAFGEAGAADITLGISSGIADEATRRFFQRLGYDRGYYGVIKSR